MSIWKRPKRKSLTAAMDTGKVQPARKPRNVTAPVAMEIKLVAIEALESGADKKGVAAVVIVGTGTLGSWHKQ